MEQDDEGSFYRLKGKAKEVDEELGLVLTELAVDGDFKGKAGSTVFGRAGEAAKALRVGMIGLGKQEEVNKNDCLRPYRQLGFALANEAKRQRGFADNTKADAAVHLPSLPDGVEEAKAAGEIGHGIYMGSFSETRYKKAAKPTQLGSVSLLGFQPGEAFDTALNEAKAHSRGIMMCKELVNAPAAHCTPETLAEAFRKVASENPDRFELTVLGKEECEKRQMEPFLAVGRGSAQEPRFIHLKYMPPEGTKESTPKVALVGKGITYDSGGINIKGQLTELMKFDMGGAGAVAGSALTFAELQPQGVEVHFIVPSCENMVDADSYRPGDILTASNGKTIEITNTDAEGRLALSEGLLYAGEQGCTKLADIATLTGGMLVSLGTHLGGVWANSEEAADKVHQASSRCEDRVWQLPLESSYWQLMDSKIADCVNAGPREAGSILAALFLEQFIPSNADWAHLDIAGCCWDWRSDRLATGFGASLLTHYAMLHASQ